MNQLGFFIFRIVPKLFPMVLGYSFRTPFGHTKIPNNKSHTDQRIRYVSDP